MLQDTLKTFLRSSKEIRHFFFQTKTKPIMNNDFLCPHCDGYLTPRENIVFSVKTESGKVGIILLSPELGNYSVIRHESIALEEGEKVSVYCPICHADLALQDEKENLVRIIYEDPQHKRHDLIFSGIFGEKCTYKITEGEVESFGEHAAKYIDYASMFSFIPRF